MALYRHWSEHLTMGADGLDRGVRDANVLRGTSGDDRLVGTDGKDRFQLFDGGDDIARGGGGDDRFDFGSTWTSADRLAGGDGNDKVFILANSLDVELSLNNFCSVERINLQVGQVDLMLDDGLSNLRIFASSSGEVHLDASRLTTGSIDIIGGIDGDVIVGGSQDDSILGLTSGDVLTGGLGDDRFLYTSFSDSTKLLAKAVDTITDLSFGDQIFLPTDQIDDFHVGATPGHTGDVLATYDAKNGRTVLDVFTDGDAVADMTVFLIGNLTNIEITHGSHVGLII